MKHARRILCLLSVLCLIFCSASAETAALPAKPVAIVSYDRAALADWTPGYGLYMPGMLLELTHTEAMLSVTAAEQSEPTQTPSEYLSARLDRAGETLSVSSAQLSKREGQSGADEFLLSYSYTYPKGDEIHLSRSWAAVIDDMLIDLTVDAWGEEAQQLIDAAMAAFIEDGFALTVHENAYELTGALSDVVEDETGLVSIQLTMPHEPFNPEAPFHALSPEAVVLFPRPDDPALLYPVTPDMVSLADAILAYEESSDSPAVFRTILVDNQIIYMEYGLMQ